MIIWNLIEFKNIIIHSGLVKNYYSSLLPDRTRGGSQKSPLVKRNCNPVWNHTFVFDCVSWAELKERSLELTIWDYDRIISNDFLGGVRLNLGTGIVNLFDTENCMFCHFYLRRWYLSSLFRKTYRFCHSVFAWPDRMTLVVNNRLLYVLPILVPIKLQRHWVSC